MDETPASQPTNPQPPQPANPQPVVPQAGQAPPPRPGAAPENGEIPEPGERPTMYGFDLDPGENITRIIRRHPLTLLPTILLAALLIVVSLAFAFGEGRFPDAIPFPPLMVFAMVSLIFVIAAIILLVGIFVFKRNVLIFTTEHLVLAEQYGLFNHRVSQIAFTRIQDVTGQKKGVAQSVFNFGNVEIQSAGAEEKFLFRGASSPQEVADEALEIHEEALRARGLSEPTD